VATAIGGVVPLWRRSRLLWLGGYGLLLAAWVGGNPPGAAPDEPGHHVKAVGVAYGQPVGRPVTPAGDFPPAKREFLESVSRSVRIPARLAPDPRWGCNAFKPTESAGCLGERTSPVTTGAAGTVDAGNWMGPYMFVPYVPIGLGARVVGTTSAALYVERAVAASMCLALLAMAIVLCRSAWSRLAILVAVTPTVVFISSVVTTSGVEITAALAHGASVLAIARGADRRAWWFYATSGSILALTRPLGPLWIVVNAALLISLTGPRHLLYTIKKHRAFTFPALGMLIASTAAAAAWAILVMPHEQASLAVGRSFLSGSVHSLPEVVRQSIGVFGWLDVGLPAALVNLGVALYGGLLLAGLVRGKARERVLLTVGLAGSLALAVYLSAFTQNPFGYTLQARYVMPMSVVVLLLAGWISEGGREPAAANVGAQAAPPTLLRAAVIASVTILHWTGWFVNASRSAVGRSGAAMFVGDPQWRPPGGWILWLTVATLGCVLIAVGAWQGVHDGEVPVAARPDAPIPGLPAARSPRSAGSSS
jgi:hypothetical protein